MRKDRWVQLSYKRNKQQKRRVFARQLGFDNDELVMLLEMLFSLTVDLTIDAQDLCMKVVSAIASVGSNDSCMLGIK